MIEIDTEKNRLDLNFIHNFISNSYWAKGRTIDTMKLCIDHSLNFGVYADNKQIGFARVVTDFGQFAYVMDVFIDEHFRNNGYAKQLLDFILNFEELQQVKTWRLATTDAHGLYNQFGFQTSEKPENLMEFFR